MADLVLRLVLLLSMTSVFRFAAPLLGAGIGLVSALSLFVLAAYVLVRLRAIRELFRSRLFLAWTVLLLIWPISTLAYSPAPAGRGGGLQVLYWLLFATAGVLVYRRGWNALRRVAGWSLLVSLVGLLASLMSPELFASTALLAGESPGHEGRAFGFFLQPNRAATSILVLGIVWNAAIGGHSLGRGVVRSLLVLLGVTLTGSRGGIVVAVVICGMMIADSGLGNARMMGRRVSLAVRLSLVMFLSAVVFGSFWYSLSTASSSLADSGLQRRVEFLLSAPSAEAFLDDASVSARLVYQAQYLDRIRRRPLEGFGLGAANYFGESGELLNSSHNLFIETSFDFGVLYGLALLITMGLTWRAARGVWPRRWTAPHSQLIAFLFASGLISNTVLIERAVLPAVGGFVAIGIFARVRSRMPESVAGSQRSVPVPSGVQ
jgi:hypothetical protein